jgi:hypothetical protein
MAADALKVFRNRRRGQRYPSGDLRQTKLSPLAIAAGMPHRRNLPSKCLSDQKGESELGRMALHGHITDLQFTAGQKYAAIVGAYRATIEMPHGLAGGGRGFDCMGDCPLPDGNESDDCICRNRKRRYDEAYKVLWKQGQKATKAVVTVAIYDNPCPVTWETELLWGLSALRDHFGLTSDKKVRYFG